MMDKPDENFRNRVASSFARQEIMRTIGAELTKVDYGVIEIEMPFRADLTQQHGFLHAGILSTALDSACGYAALSVMPHDAAVLTIEFKINLLSPGRGDRFLFRGEVTKPGSTIIVTDGRAYAVADGPAKLIASMTGSMMVVRGREGIEGMTGEIKPAGDRRILYVMAAEAEYGQHLRARFAPLITGVGPVEAAVAMSARLAQCGPDLPDCIVSLGSAGSNVLEQTGIYQVSSVSYRDMDASPLGFEKGRTPFLDLPAVLPLPVIADGVASASLSTGANIVSGAAYDGIDAEMVDMETFAVLRAASRFSVPVLGLRGISDGKSELNHIDDWTEYLHIIDEKLAQAVDRVEAAIASGAALA